MKLRLSAACGALTLLAGTSACGTSDNSSSGATAYPTYIEGPGTEPTSSPEKVTNRNFDGTEREFEFEGKQYCVYFEEKDECENNGSHARPILFVRAPLTSANTLQNAMLIWAIALADSAYDESELPPIIIAYVGKYKQSVKRAKSDNRFKNYVNNGVISPKKPTSAPTPTSGTGSGSRGGSSPKPRSSSGGTSGGRGYKPSKPGGSAPKPRHGLAANTHTLGCFLLRHYVQPLYSKYDQFSSKPRVCHR